MRFRANISMDTKAFDNPTELAHVLRTIADQVLTGSGRIALGEYPVVDSKGERIGGWTIK